MTLGDLAHQREPQPHAAVFALLGARRAVKGLEDPFALGLGHTGTTVSHHHSRTPARGFHGRLDRRAARVSARVLEKVAQRPSQQAALAADLRRGTSHHGAHPGALLREESRGRDDMTQRYVDILSLGILRSPRLAGYEMKEPAPGRVTHVIHMTAESFSAQTKRLTMRSEKKMAPSKTARMASGSSSIDGGAVWEYGSVGGRIIVNGELRMVNGE